jgi:hypothetical protein
MIPSYRKTRLACEIVNSSESDDRRVRRARPAPSGDLRFQGVKVTDETVAEAIARDEADPPIAQC